MKHDILDNTKEGKGNYMMLEIQNVKFNSMGWAAKLNRFQRCRNNGTRGRIKK
jgi:hypothetical protein